MLTSLQEAGHVQSHVLPPWFSENDNTAPLKLLPLNTPSAGTIKLLVCPLVSV